MTSRATAATVHVLRVFCREDGTGGNPLGLVLDGPAVPRKDRQDLAAALAFSETVLIDDRHRGELEIYTPATQLPFAGHPLVGTAWLLAREGTPLETLRPPAGEIAVRLHGEDAFIAADPAWSPAFDYVELAAPAEVDALSGPPGDGELVSAWAWLDREAGTVRARVFARGLGVPEDEATGSAAIGLCARLGRAIEIHQGTGSLLRTRPLTGGLVEVGGRVVLDEVRGA